MKDKNAAAWHRMHPVNKLNSTPQLLCCFHELILDGGKGGPRVLCADMIY